MITEAFFLAMAIGIFFISGFIILTIVGWKETLRLSLFMKAPISYMLGLGAVSLQMFLYSLASIPFNVLNIAGPWLLTLAVLVYMRPPITNIGVRVSFRDIGYFDWFLILVITSQVVYAFTYAVLVPISGSDAYQTWFFKAKVFFVDKGLRTEFFSTPEVHPDYPLMVPLSAAWIYTAIGTANEQMAKIIYPLKYLSLISIFYFISRKFISARISLIFTTLLSITPIVMIHSGGLPGTLGVLCSGDFVGYADLALSICFLSGAGFFALYTLDAKRPYLMLAAIFLGLAAWTKDEGLVSVLTCGILIVVHIITQRISWRHLLSFIVITSSVIAPWLIYKNLLDIPGEYEGHIGLKPALANIGRVPVILDYMFSMFFRRTELYNFTWYLYLGTSLINWRKSLQRPLVYLHILIISQISAYLLIYLVTFLDIQFHLETSFDRLALHILPLSLLIASINVGAILSMDNGINNSKIMRGDNDQKGNI